MAISRCKIHPPVNNRGNIYNHSVEPLGYPHNTSTICGRDGCTEPGLIYMTDKEVVNYNNGQRIFEYTGTRIAKVKVKDNSLKRNS